MIYCSNWVIGKANCHILISLCGGKHRCIKIHPPDRIIFWFVIVFLQKFLEVAFTKTSFEKVAKEE